jgi:hypothetical protein
MNKTRLVAGLTLSILTGAIQAAQYSVVELPLVDKGVNNFPTAINAQGKITTNTQSPFNPPIDVSLINFESPTIIAGLTDIDAAMAGQPNEADYLLLYNIITAANASGPSQGFQQISALHSYVADEQSAEFVSGFDQLSAGNNEYTFSTETNVRGINDVGSTAGGGQDVFYTLPYTSLPNIDEDTGEDSGSIDLNYVLNNFLLRAFATINGSTVALAPIAIEAGGLSDAYDINNNNQVVGVGSTVNTSENLQTQIDICIAGEQLNADDELVQIDVPLESCLRSVMTTASFNTVFQQRTMIWQLDDVGNVLSSKALGLLLSAEEQAEVQATADARSDSDTDPEVVFVSQGRAINDNGIAVGLASALYRDTESVSTFAAIFIDDTVSEITDDQDYFRSIATDINNQDIVVGHAFKSINGSTRSKFFVHDINSGDTRFPEDFFVGSASLATAINNSGKVVGYGQIEAGVGNTPRRTAGFIYDDNTQEFQNINTLLECNSSFSIVQANGINDANEIAATAVVQRAARDIRGEPVLDSDGAEVLVDRIVAVKLLPIAEGSIDDCGEDTLLLDRQGAGIGWLSMFALLLLGTRLRIRP